MLGFGGRFPRWAAPVAMAALTLAVGGFAITGRLASRQGGGHSTTTQGQACTSKFSVSPTSGTTGTSITLHGSAWPANKTLGIYLVDPSHHLRPTTLRTMTIPSDGAWSATVVVPETVTFHAVGDQTTSGNGAAQTITQSVAPGRYLLYAAVGDAPSYSIQTVCPVTFSVREAASALGVPGGHTPSTSSAQVYASGRSSMAPPWALALFMLLMGAAGGLMLWYRSSPTLRSRLVRQVRALGLHGLAGMARVFRRQIFVSAQLALLLAIVASVLPLVGQVSAAPRMASATSLYSDDFETDTLGALPSGWTVEAGANWAVQASATPATQVLAQTSASPSTLYGIYAGSASWTDYTVAADVQPGAGSTTVNTSVVALDGRRQDANNFYSLLVKNGNAWYLGLKVNGVWSTLAQGSFTYTPTAWYHWTLTLAGSTISASINGTPLATATDSTFTSGNIGVKTRNQSAFDNVVVSPIGTPTATPTATPSPTVTPTPSPTATVTPSPTPTATPTPSPTPMPTATPTPSAPGTISGQITDAATGAPIVSAAVATVPASTTTMTDSNGNYVLQNLGPNTYDVVIMAAGYNMNHVPGVALAMNGTATASASLQPVPGYTAMDLYTRPDQVGWNPATDGNMWADDASIYPGVAVSIQGNTGYVDTYTAATDRDEWMAPWYADQLVSADFNVDTFGQDAYQHGPRLLGRILDAHHYIDFAINYASSTLQLWVNNNENWTMLKQVAVPKFITGQWYHAELLTVGGESYAKVWAYDTPEPAWQITGSQTSLTTGGGGLRSTYANIHWTNFSVQGVTTITGLIRDSSGTPIPGVTVTDGQGTSVTTDSRGRYVIIEPNTAATYTVTASANGYTSHSATVVTTTLQAATQNFTLS